MANGFESGPMTSTLADRCERCGRRHVADWVWLELDAASLTYHRPGTVDPARSQGLFRFGRQCATKQLAHKPRHQ